MIKFLSFPSSWQWLDIPHSLLKDIFSGYKLLGWKFFSFIFENYYTLGPPCFWWEICCNWILLFSHSLERALFLLKLSRYFLSSVFRSLSLLYLCTDFLEFILFEVFLASCQIWKIFSHYFLKHFEPCPLLIWSSSDTNIRSFVVIPQLPEALHFFPPNIFLCGLDWMFLLAQF